MNSAISPYRDGSSSFASVCHSSLCGRGNLSINCKKFRTAYNSWSGRPPLCRGFIYLVKGFGFPSSQGVYLGIALKEANAGGEHAAAQETETKAKKTLEPPAQSESVTKRDEVKENNQQSADPGQEAGGQGGNKAGSSCEPNGKVEVASPQPQGLVFRGDLFGEFNGANVRRTDETPPRISIHDLVGAVTGAVHPRVTWTDLEKKFEGEGVQFPCTFFKFLGSRTTGDPSHKCSWRTWCTSSTILVGHELHAFAQSTPCAS